MGSKNGSTAILDLLRAAHELASEHYDSEADVNDESPEDQMLHRMGLIVRYLGQAIERIEKWEAEGEPQWCDAPTCLGYWWFIGTMRRGSQVFNVPLPRPMHVRTLCTTRVVSSGGGEPETTATGVAFHVKGPRGLGFLSMHCVGLWRYIPEPAMPAQPMAQSARPTTPAAIQSAAKRVEAMLAKLDKTDTDSHDGY